MSFTILLLFTILLDLITLPYCLVLYRFTKLIGMTSIHEATDKPCKKVLESLQISAAKFMGWQEEGRCNRRTKPVNIMDHQITMESFVAVLRELRSFEIFAPDVSAAIEFMKNEIVKAPDEQFEDIIKKLVNSRNTVMRQNVC